MILINAADVERGIVDIAWSLALEPTDTNGQRIAERHVNRSSHPVAHAIAMGHIVHISLCISTQGVGRGLKGYKFDQTPYAARAIQRSLRTTQYLDSRQIARVDVGCERPRQGPR